jgi:hypothetical protein
MQACSKNTLKIASEISCRNRQRLQLSWSSSSRVRNTSLQIKIYFDGFFIICFMSHCSTYSTQSRVSRRDQISISIPILVIQALNCGITSTNVVVIHLQHPPHSPTHPSNMTFVSNDPSLWPIIDIKLFYTYWTGLSYQSVSLDLTSTCILQLPPASW